MYTSSGGFEKHAAAAHHNRCLAGKELYSAFAKDYNGVLRFIKEQVEKRKF